MSKDVLNVCQGYQAPLRQVNENYTLGANFGDVVLSWASDWPFSWQKGQSYKKIAPPASQEVNLNRISVKVESLGRIFLELMHNCNILGANWAHWPTNPPNCPILLK